MSDNGPFAFSTDPAHVIHHDDNADMRRIQERVDDISLALGISQFGFWDRIDMKLKQNRRIM